VPALRDRVGPGGARRAVPTLDVTEAPGDLGDRVRPPVRAHGRHLRARQRLRDAVRARAGVVGVDAPVALLRPQLVEARELVVAPPALRGERAPDGPR